MTKKMELADRIAIVTGAGTLRGIGRQTALLLADAGADVAVVDKIITEELIELAEEIRRRGRKAIALSADQRSTREITECVARVSETLGIVDILINNAGSTIGAAPLLDIVVDELDESYFINLRGPAVFCQACIPGMKKLGGGAIVNNASTGGLGASAGFGAYTASKHALVGLTKSIAAEFGVFGIRCNVVCPGFTMTDMHLAVNARMAEEAGVSISEISTTRYSRVALRRVADPSEIADAIVFLAGPRSAYITGIALPVSGGVPNGL